MLNKQLEDLENQIKDIDNVIEDFNKNGDEDSEKALFDKSQEYEMKESIEERKSEVKEI